MRRCIIFGKPGRIRPRKDKRGIDLISDALPFGRLWCGDTNAVANAIGYVQHFSRSHDAVIRVYDPAGNVIETLGAISRSGESCKIVGFPNGFGEILHFLDFYVAADFS